MGGYRLVSVLRHHTSELRRLPRLRSQVHTLQLPLEQNPAVGWKPHHLFRGSTPGIAQLGCHVSILDPGCQPHPPHRHAEEEILVILDGETELVLEDVSNPQAVVRHRVERGTYAYYPTGFAHTIHNTSRAPVTYVMFKWTTSHKGGTGDLGHRLVALSDPREPEAPGRDGFAASATLDGPTRCLQHLHSHVTTLQPEAGYAPHADRYDVAIVTLEGVVQTLGQRAEPHSIVFYPAGELHGMRNVGATPALYLVFELHSRRWRAGPRVEHQLRRARRATSRAAQGLRSGVRPDVSSH
jgi:quercetin dioxygenase-like cupin family protein